MSNPIPADDELDDGGTDGAEDTSVRGASEPVSDKDRVNSKARRSIEDYLEEKRLKRELDDFANDDFDSYQFDDE